MSAAAVTPQPASGVSADRESILMIVYPSIASKAIGRLLGSLYESIPLKINGIKLSHLLFTLPTAPFALIGYLQLKITGVRYVLTNRSVQAWKALGSHRLAEVPLTQIEEITVTRRRGQEFFRAADLTLLAADGKTLLTIAGLPQADVFREVILQARNARRQVLAALETIQARHKA